MDEHKPKTPDLLSSNGAIKKEPVFPDFEIRSEEVQEIIGRPPHWLVRWGIASFFIVLALIFLSASTIQYPETLQSSLRLTAINAPKTVEAKVSGKIVRLFYDDNMSVEEGDVLAWLESTADHASVMQLSGVLDSLDGWLQSQEFGKIQDLGALNLKNLGSLQAGFQQFEQVYREFLAYLPGAYYHDRKEILEEELAYTRQLLEHLEAQKIIQQTTLQFAEREYEAQKKLAEKDLIASLELERAESNLANQRLPLQQTESSIINNRMSQSAKMKEIMELNRQIEQQRALFSQAVFALKSGVDDWKYNYLLTAPTSGTLLYAGIFQEKQTVAAGQELFIIHSESTEFFGELAISQQSFGKIEEGQQVLVRFNGYPHSEFGSVQAVIEYLSAIPVRDSLFFARVEFPEGLKTNYGYDLTPKNGMIGRAEIITQDMRLITRIYNNLTKELR
ncbi:MAG: HlyD family efflux transporter periplasmic adaptor subunit [Gracilimonas sp.]